MGIVEVSEVQSAVIVNNSEVHQSLLTSSKGCASIIHLNLFTPACSSGNSVDITGDQSQHGRHSGTRAAAHLATL